MALLMDIVSLNKTCPNASHSHRVANEKEIQNIKKNNPQILTNNQLCLYCDPKKELLLKTTVYCDQYRHQIIIKLLRIKLV